MIHPVLASRYGITGVLGSARQREAVSGDWWLTGGIPAANCIAAYQPIGAADYATSLVNLANPGTYNATEGTTPGWDALYGWRFDGANDWLTTGVVFENDQSWSIVIRFLSDNTKNRALSLARTTSGSNEMGIVLGSYASEYAFAYNGNWTFVSNVDWGSNDSVFAIAGNAIYFNSVSKGTISAGSGTNTLAIPLGCMDTGAARSFFYDGDMYAVSIYDAAITQAQVTALTTAMAAL